MLAWISSGGSEKPNAVLLRAQVDLRTLDRGRGDTEVVVEDVISASILCGSADCEAISASSSEFFFVLKTKR